jgi:hypothetical protein
MLKRAGLAALGTALVALAAPAASLAASADLAPGAVLQYTGGAAESNHLEISFDMMTSRFVLADSGVSSITLGMAAQKAHCAVTGTQLTCPWGSLYAIDVQLGGGATGFAHSALAWTHVTLRAGAGTDTLSGGSTLIGGPGTDTLTAGTSGAHLVAGSGNTTMTGGSHTDSFQGGSGDDSINSRDGIAEQVSCGGGTDTVVADPSDTVAADCESVDVGAQAAAPPADGSTQTSDPPTGSDPIPAASVSSAPITVGSGHTLGVPLTCPATAASGCDGQLILTLSGGQPTAKLVAARRERTMIGKSRRFHIAAGRKATVPVRLSRRGARILRTRGHKKRRVLKVPATVVTKTAAGTTRTTSTIRVRAARRRPTPQRRRKRG